MPLTEVKTVHFPAKPIESAHSRVERAIQARRGIKGKKMQAGHCIGYTESPASGKVHVLGSVLSQINSGEGTDGGVRDEHVRYRKIAGRGRRNILFLVDTSGSMVASGRLAMVKGCVISLLGDAYVSRTRVAIVGFGGLKARLVLPFTSSAEMAARHIDDMKGGGGTPLLDAIRIATPLIESMEAEPAEVVLLSDGGYDRPRKASPERVIRSFAAFCKKRNVPIYLVDSGSGTRTAQKRAERLAAMLHARYRQLDDMRAESLEQAIAFQEESSASCMPIV